MGEKLDLQEEEAEEALSLCDLAITTGDDNTSGDPSNHIRRSASEPPEFFEFLNDLSSDMCSAEDVIFCGKLIPFKEQTAPIQIQPPKMASFKPNSCHRRSESLSNLRSSTVRSNSTKTKVMRNSRSLDCRKLHRSSNSMISPAPEIERNLSAGGSNKRALKPRWYFLMFGMVKFPTEMMLGEIKNRQFKRSPPLFPPAVEIPTHENYPVNRKERKCSWKLLKVLSCKDHASIAVTASFHRIPEI